MILYALLLSSSLAFAASKVSRPVEGAVTMTHLEVPLNRPSVTADEHGPLPANQTTDIVDTPPKPLMTENQTADLSTLAAHTSTRNDPSNEPDPSRHVATGALRDLGGKLQAGVQGAYGALRAAFTGSRDAAEPITD